MSVPVEQMQALVLTLASLKYDMAEIKGKLDGKVTTLHAEEAVAAFRVFLEKNRTPNTGRSYLRLLKDFEEVYADRNIPDISASELEEFLRERCKAFHA